MFPSPESVEREVHAPDMEYRLFEEDLEKYMRNIDKMKIAHRPEGCYQITIFRPLKQSNREKLETKLLKSGWMARDWKSTTSDKDTYGSCTFELWPISS